MGQNDPASCLAPLALRTVAIAARVIRLLDMVTSYAAVKVTTECRRTTAHDIAGHLRLHRGGCRLTGVRIPVRPKYVSYLTLRTSHVTTALAQQVRVNALSNSSSLCCFSARSLCHSFAKVPLAVFSSKEPLTSWLIHSVVVSQGCKQPG